MARLVHARFANAAITSRSLPKFQIVSHHWVDMTAPPADLRDALATQYLLQHEIGRGGMATVYAAHDLRHDRRVALKIVRHDPQWAWHVAEIFALGGLRDEAIGMLDHAIHQGFCNVPMLESRDATLASVRNDPRFTALIERARASAAALESALR